MLVIEARKMVFILTGTVVGLLLGHTVGLFLKFGLGQDFCLGFVPLFDFDREGNLPAFVSTMLLLLCAALAGLIGWTLRRQKDLRWIGWIGIAVLFIYVSLDETISIHEQLIVPTRVHWGLSGYLYFGWVIPYGIFVCILVIGYGRFVQRLPTHVRRIVILSAAVYLTGALGMELVGGRYFDFVDEQLNLTYALITTTEELLEMAGAILFVTAELMYIQSQLLEVTIIVAPRRAQIGQREACP